MHRRLALGCLLCLLRVAAASDACYGAGVVLEPEGPVSRSQIWYGLQAPFGGALPAEKPKPLELAVADPLDACIPALHAVSYTGKVVLAARGNCTFVEKAVGLQTVEAAALLVYNNEPGCSVLGANLTDPEVEALVIPVIGISHACGQHFMQLAANKGTVVLWAPAERSRLDPSALLIWVLAVSTAAAAALSAGSDYLHGRQLLTNGTSAHGRRSAVSTAQAEDAMEVQMVSGLGAIAFVVIASTMLVVLFFFLNRAFSIILVVLFCTASFQALVIAFSAGISLALPNLSSSRVSLGWLGSAALLSLLATAPAAVWVAAWFVFNPTTLGWIFQDGMGISLMILVLRQFLLPDLKVACVLLPLVFVYDVFWVFIQPLLTHGPSVMVEVAMGGSSHESMPMLLQVPGLFGPPYGTSILGFGDVVLPGLLLVFARIWDCALRKPLSSSYFPPLLAGYGTGLLITYLALLFKVGGDQGQPALLWLVPCTLGLVLVLAWLRGELGAMWKGLDHPSDLKRSVSEIPEPDMENVAHEADMVEAHLLCGGRSMSSPWMHTDEGM